MQKYYVYEWIRLDTLEPFYVGKGSKERWCNTYDSRTKEFRDIALNISCAINFIIDDVDEDMAFLVERLMVESYMFDSPYELVNIAQGGSGRRGVPISQETRNKISKANKGVKFDDDHKSKISIALKEYRKNNPNHPTTKGRVPSQSERDKISESLKGKMAGSKHPNANTFDVIYQGERKTFGCAKEFHQEYFKDAPYNTIRSNVSKKLAGKKIGKGRGSNYEINLAINEMEFIKKDS